MRKKLIILISILFMSFVLTSCNKKVELAEKAAPDKVVIVWSSGDIEVAQNVVFLFTSNALKFGWWKEVTLVVWGPSSKLLSENIGLQDEVKKMMDSGIIVEACKGCADNYGVSDDLEAIGITVRYMGEPLTEYLKSNTKVMTF